MTDAQRLQDLIKSKPQNLKKAKRQGIPAQIFTITAQYPMLRDLRPPMAEAFLPAVCAIMDGDYPSALVHFLQCSETAKIAAVDTEVYLRLGINLSAAAEAHPQYIHFSKVHIEYLISQGRGEEARAELNGFLEILPGDNDLRALQNKLDGITETQEGENIYVDTAWLYEVMKNRTGKVTQDILFYLNYAKKHGAEVLDIGCGGGRISIPLAQQGHTVTSMDLSEQMLAHFRKKLDKLPDLAPRITLVQGSAADFDFGRKFPMIIMPDRVFQLMTDEADAKACLRCVHAHLTDDGIFIINTYNVTKSREENFMRGIPMRKAGATVDKETGARVVFKESMGKTDVFNRLTRFVGEYEVSWPDGRRETFAEHHFMKYYYEPQLRAMVEAAGFEIREHFGAYDKKPRPEPTEIIYVCKKRP